MNTEIDTVRHANSMIRTLTLVLLALPILASGQNDKFPPRDDSGKSPELKAFVSRLKEIIKNRDGGTLMTVLHPKIKFDFDEGIGIEKFLDKWHPEDKSSKLWSIMERIVTLGGVFPNNQSEPFYAFVFPYVNQIELDADQYFNTLVVTGKDVYVREKPNVNSKAVAKLSHNIVNFDYEKSPDDNWCFVQTMDKTIAGYVSADLVYSPVDYRMFLTKETGKWMISCLVAGD